MGTSQGWKAEFSIKDIFTTCRDFYHNYAYFIATYREINKNIGNVCNRIRDKYGRNHDGNNSFFGPCTKLAYYLHRIKPIKENERIHYCNFFMYELNLEVKNKVKTEYSIDTVHDALVKEYQGVGVDVRDVCKGYVSKMDDDVIDIFTKFHDLYFNFKYLKINYNNRLRIDEYVNKCVNIYEEIIRKEKKAYNNFVQKELDIFKREFHKYKQKNPFKCDDKLMNHSLIIPPVNESYALIGDIDSPVTWTSTGVLFFAILIIIFIYTAYGSYLRPGKRKLKYMWNRKNKKHYELMNLFEESQKNIIQNKHNILYNSVD
ncbi:variable surface protein [Plasmodium gonderi]|uniref:Variable surface protein n=1 Tax=Plasmodium gonderi TaxID=77519 RepID=A0A1Y1JVD2_PLAGO|nr:variable surface protein [Plasmodium gonderi]GAW84343.1 variable surface protein [Plasmodium gonderi]